MGQLAQHSIELRFVYLERLRHARIVARLFPHRRTAYCTIPEVFTQELLDIFFVSCWYAEQERPLDVQTQRPPRPLRLRRPRPRPEAHFVGGVGHVAGPRDLYSLNVCTGVLRVRLPPPPAHF